MAFLVNWFWSLLRATGLTEKKGNLVLLGLDNAGKTTLMSMLRDNVLKQYTPTQKPTMEEFRMGGIVFQTHDLGGHAIARRLWKEFTVNANGIIFILDSSDRDRFAEVKEELDGLLADENTTIPIAVLANKIDRPNAVSEDELRAALGLFQTHGKDPTTAAIPGVRPIELFMCSITLRQGYKEALTWIGQFLS
jgi:GTP-binding protein SAR1